MVSVKQVQVTFDCAEPEAECARLVPLGAVRGLLLRADGENESCLGMQDIEGNEFCLD
jgi:hypothetical protein